jgi:hypothetical protein
VEHHRHQQFNLVLKSHPRSVRVHFYFQ